MAVCDKKIVKASIIKFPSAVIEELWIRRKFTPFWTTNEKSCVASKTPKVIQMGKTKLVFSYSRSH